MNKSSINLMGPDPDSELAPMIITFDPKVLVEAKDKAGQIVFDPSAEDVIVKFLQLKQKVEEAEAFIKAEVEKQGLALSENFSSVSSDKLKVNYSASGAEFGYDKSKRQRFPEPLFTKKVTYTPNSKEIKKYREKTGKWPSHVFVNKRKKTIRLSLKES